MKNVFVLFFVLALVGCNQYVQTEHGCKDTKTGKFVKAELCE